MEQETNVEEEVMDELEDNLSEDDSGTDEEESGEESELEDSENLSDDDNGEPEADVRRESQNRAKAQIDRLKEEKRKLKEENDRLKKGSPKGSEEVKATNSELIERTYLAANGIQDKEIQNEVLRLAHKFDISIDEAMDDTDIKGRADTLMKQKKARQSVARGTGGAGVKSKGVDYYTAYFNKNGDFPAGMSNDMIAKVTDKLAKQ